MKEPYLRVSSTGPVVQPVITTQSSPSQDSASMLSVSDQPPVTNADACGIVEALGSLAITRNGRTKYFGPAAMASVSISLLYTTACVTDNISLVLPSCRYRSSTEIFSNLILLRMNNLNQRHIHTTRFWIYCH
jgi:hypothetical protein